MKLSNITQFIANNPERIIFGVCAIICLVVLAGYFAGGEENEMISSASRNAADLKEVINLNEPAALGKVEYLKKIKGIWEEIQQPIEGKAWLMYRLPVVAVKFVPEMVITRDKKSNLAPTAKTIKANDEKPDEITLAWDGNISSTAQIKSYKIYRRAQGEKDFTMVIEIPAVAPVESGYTHIDKGLKSETEYLYCFTSVSDEQDAIKQESDRSGELKATTPKDYKIEFKTVDEKNSRVWAKIEKYLNGKWDGAQGFINKGDKIDKDKFVTGCTLVDIQSDIKEVKMDDGKIRKVPIFNIIYIDKKGVKVIREVVK